MKKWLIYYSIEKAVEYALQGYFGFRKTLCL